MSYYDTIDEISCQECGACDHASAECLLRRREPQPHGGQSYGRSWNHNPEEDWRYHQQNYNDQQHCRYANAEPQHVTMDSGHGPDQSTGDDYRIQDLPTGDHHDSEEPSRGEQRQAEDVPSTSYTRDPTTNTHDEDAHQGHPRHMVRLAMPPRPSAPPRQPPCRNTENQHPGNRERTSQRRRYNERTFQHRPQRFPQQRWRNTDQYHNQGQESYHHSGYASRIFRRSNYHGDSDESTDMRVRLKRQNARQHGIPTGRGLRQARENTTSA